MVISTACNIMNDEVLLTIRLPQEAATAVINLVALIKDAKVLSVAAYKKSVKKNPKSTEQSSGASINEIDLSETTKRYQFIEKCKEVALKIGELNGEKLTTTPRGVSIDFNAEFDAKGCCDMLDTLYKEHTDNIEDYLEGVLKPTGISIVLPFMGKILTECLFSSEQSLHKANLIEKLGDIYPRGNIRGYLSFNGRKRKEKLNHLFNGSVDIMIEKRKGQLGLVRFYRG